MRIVGREVICRSRSTGGELNVLNSAKLLASSEGLGWKGVKIVVGMLDRGWAVDDLVVDGHWLTINLGNSPVKFEAQCGAELWNAEEQTPLSFCVNPKDRPFSVRHNASVCFASCMIDELTFNDMAGGDFELPMDFDLADDVLAGMMRAIAACLFEKNIDYNQKLLNDMLQSFVQMLSIRHGQKVTESPRGAITPAELGGLTEWLKTILHDRFTVGDMADRLGRSSSHFSREFRRAAGMAPWNFVMKLRLDAALEAVRDGCSTAEAACRAGFADTAHFRRTYRRHLSNSSSVRSV